MKSFRDFMSCDSLACLRPALWKMENGVFYIIKFEAVLSNRVLLLCLIP
jgi:hypothetical protein